MKLVYQYMVIFKPHQVIFIHYKPRIATAINSRLVVDKDDNGKFRLERVKGYTWPTVFDDDLTFGSEVI